jgi:hypothetical protein
MRSALFACFGLAIISGCAISIADGKEGEWRWRLFEMENEKVVLTYHDSNHLTDSVTTQFECRRSSGRADLVGVANESLLHALGDTVRNGSYPRGDLVPESNDGAILIQPRFSEMYGWEYLFDFSVKAVGFEQFKRTGIFQFKMGSTVVAWKELKEGLENVAKFQEACSRGPK